MVFLFRLLFPGLALEVWALRGKTPLAQERPRYCWLYVYALVRPGRGESEYWLLPSVWVEGFQLG